MAYVSCQLRESVNSLGPPNPQLGGFIIHAKQISRDRLCRRASIDQVIYCAVANAVRQEHETLKTTGTKQILQKAPLSELNNSKNDCKTRRRS